jgi:hypothetical protein
MLTKNFPADATFNQKMMWPQNEQLLKDVFFWGCVIKRIIPAPTYL